MRIKSDVKERKKERIELTKEKETIKEKKEKEEKGGREIEKKKTIE